MTSKDQEQGRLSVENAGQGFRKEGESFVLRVGGVEMEINPRLGGRVTGFRFEGSEVLTGPDVVSAGDETLQNMFGSTFWTSPQSAWGWPPEPPVDSEPYAARLDSQVLSLEGKSGATTHVSVAKRFSAGAGGSNIEVAYTMMNHGESLSAAPWEITRVFKRGLVLFPSDSAPSGDSTLSSQAIDGVAWLDVAGAPPGDSKLFQDGTEGWLAYVSDAKVLIKTFKSIPRDQQAPGEAEVEVFVSGDYDYVELEQQGTYAELPKGGEATWNVGWWLVPLPEGMKAVPGNSDLVKWIREVIAGGSQ